jgi:hypothetical protein
VDGKLLIAVVIFVSALLAGLSGIASAQQASLNSRLLLSSGELMGGWYNADTTVSNRSSYAIEDGEVRGHLTISGTAGVGKWNYAGSPKFLLLGGRSYRLSGLMLVKSISDQTHPPYLKLALFQRDQWLVNFNSQKYDLARMNEWQALYVDFKVPDEDGFKGSIALEKGTKDVSLQIEAELSNILIEMIR